MSNIPTNSLEVSLPENDSLELLLDYEMRMIRAAAEAKILRQQDAVLIDEELHRIREYVISKEQQLGVGHVLQQMRLMREDFNRITRQLTYRLKVAENIDSLMNGFPINSIGLN